MAFALSRETKRLTLGQPFVLESGEVLPEVTIAYRTWGRLSPDADNAVVICHALTGSADADVWWSPLFGSGKALDPDRHFIVCSNVLGGCYGTTGPTSNDPIGEPWSGRFPRITVRDQVRVQMALADVLGILGIKFVIGGSMGGLQALEWALLDPERVQAVVSIAASGRHSPWCMVWSEAQRQALNADPRFNRGYYDPADPPLLGLAAARAIAMVSYRSPEGLEQRFGRALAGEVYGKHIRSPVDFAAKSWLRHHGASLVERFDANSYCVLLDAMDTHDLARGRGVYEQVLRLIRRPVLIGSVTTDALYVPAEQRSLAMLLSNARFFEIDSAHGHDGFLTDASMFETILRQFVSAEGEAAEFFERIPAQPESAASYKYAW